MRQSRVCARVSVCLCEGQHGGVISWSLPVRRRIQCERSGVEGLIRLDLILLKEGVLKIFLLR